MTAHVCVCICKYREIIMRDAQPLVINNETETGGIKSNIHDFILILGTIVEYFSMKIMLFILLKFLFTN